MDVILKVGVVILLGFIQLWGAVPAGLAMGLDPVLTVVGTCIGAIISAMLVIILGKKARTWIVSKFAKKDKKEQFGFIERVFHRYGAIGFGLISPLIPGVCVGMAIGIALGIPARRLTLWMMIGVFTWTTLLTTLAMLGITVISSLWRI